MVQMVASNSVLPKWKSYTQSNSPSRYYVLEKNTDPSSSFLFIKRKMGDFHLYSVKTQRFMVKALHNSEKILIFAAEL